MLTTRLRARIPAATPVDTAYLPEFALRFQKRSQDGSAKCNIVPSAQGKPVYGVIFDVSSANVDALDEAEQRGRGYERRTVSVHTETERADAFAYVAQPQYVNDALHPYSWYQDLVVAGAREHALPQPYIARLAAVPSVPDPVRARREKHEALLRRAGFSAHPYWA